MAREQEALTTTERAALALGRLANESNTGKMAQWTFHQLITKTWVGFVQRNRIFIEGLDWLTDLEPDRGVLVASNHRTFFDQYVMMLAMYEMKVKWAKRIYFPVRANFFYEKPVGILLNFLVGGGTMYPPIFRDTARAEYNKAAVDRVVEFLGEPNTLVGMHPEGTRGKGPDPYQMLKAQPGVGQMVLQGRPIVVPLWINGLSNDFIGDIKSNWHADIQRTNPVIIVGGQPVDYSALTDKKPRASLYLRCANLIRAEILELAEREKVIRAQCASGEIGADHPGWLTNRH